MKAKRCSLYTFGEEVYDDRNGAYVGRTLYFKDIEGNLEHTDKTKWCALVDGTTYKIHNGIIDKSEFLEE